MDIQKHEEQYIDRRHIPRTRHVFIEFRQFML